MGHMEHLVQTMTDYLRAWDLNPQPMLVPRRPRTQWGGFLHLLYLPVLLFYLLWIVSPIYGPLPSCCVCATSIPNANNTWIWEGTSVECDKDCQERTNNQLMATCRSLVQSPLPTGPGFFASYKDITCFGDIPGEPCSDNCRAISTDWLAAVNYRNELNLNEMKVRCPSITNRTEPRGVCQFMALWYNPVAHIFPQGLCRYPSVRGLLAQFGAALGLISGLFVTIRSISRSAWIQLGKKHEPLGTWSSYLWGFGFTTIFNYIAFSYYLLAPRHVTKMARYGSQTAVGFLLLFASSPLIVVFVYIFSEMWPALLLTAMVRIGAVGMILYTACLIIICDLDRNEMKVRRSLWASAREPRYLLVLLMLCGLIGSIFTIIAVVIRNRFNPVTSARRTAVWRGATAGLCLLALVILWAVITPFGWWQSHLTLDLPVSLTNKSTLSNNLHQSLFQGLYSVFSSFCIVVISFAICAFFRELPVQHDIGSPQHANQLSSTGDFNSLTAQEPNYHPRHFRLSFVIAVVPSLFSFAYFLAFSYSAFQVHDPSAPSECQFPWTQLITAVCCLIPSALLWTFGTNVSVRSGAFSGFGFNIVALGEAFWILAFDFCIGDSGGYLFIIIWFIQLFGAVSLIFGVFGLVTRQRLRRLRIAIAPEEQINYAPSPDPAARQSLFSFFSGDDDDSGRRTPLNLKPLKTNPDELASYRSEGGAMRSTWSGSTTSLLDQ